MVPFRNEPCGCESDDQLPIVSRVGRGIHGDDFKVEISSDAPCETHLAGSSFDHTTKEWTSEWVSENINGGCLSYQYKLRPYTVPQTFTITFIYRRPGRPEWSWTTPAIPYVWSIDDDGGKQPGDPDAVVGSGVATIFVKDGKDKPWVEKLVYPAGTDREDYNAPEQGEAWTSNLYFGVGGDIEVPNLGDLALVIGITEEQIKQIIQGSTGVIGGSDNVKNYIDDQDDKHVDEALDHVHEDLGFDEGFLPGDGGSTSVKKYIDDKASQIQGEVDASKADIEALRKYLKNALTDILAKVYLGGTLGEDGNITWPNANKIPIGDLNVFSASSPTNSTVANAIRSRALSDNDIRTI